MLKGIFFDIFEMTFNICEPTMKPMNREFLIFKRCQVDVKNIKCPFQWWEQHEIMFHMVGFYARQILRIVRSQIGAKRIFSLTRMLTSLKKCCLQSKHLEKFIFVNKNWPNDPRIDCKSPFSLVDLEELEELERTFERDETLEFYI
jgi:hypothetical protein